MAVGRQGAGTGHLGALGGVIAPQLDVVTRGLFVAISPRRVVSSYIGLPLVQVTREQDGALRDLYPAGNGWCLNSDDIAWGGGSQLFVTIGYDQSGNGRNWTQGNSTKRVVLCYDGDHPVFDFSGISEEMSLTAGLAAFSQSVNAATVVAVRKHDVSTYNQTDRLLFFASTGGGATRMALGPRLATNSDSASGRRLDGDSVVQTTGFTPDTNWNAEFLRMDWANAKLPHAIGSQSETKDPFQTAGSTSATASSSVSVGGSGSGGGLNAKISLFACYSVLLTDQEVATLKASLVTLQPAVPLANQFLSWGNTDQTAVRLSNAPGKTDYTVFTPSGAATTAADLASHRYHHHTRGKWYNGRLWLMASSSLNNEDASGQMVVGFTTPSAVVSWTAPFEMCPPQCTMADTTGVGADRIMWPREFIVYSGALYAVMAIQSGTGGTGLALVARQCNDDGTLGAVFRVTPGSYAALSGVATIPYDGVLGPALYAITAPWGPWGGSKYPTVSDWVGEIGQGGQGFAEAGQWDINNDTLFMQQLWRKTSGVRTNWLYSRIRDRRVDPAADWSALSISDIPNSPSSVGSIRFSDGRLGMLHNPRDAAFSRDYLTLSLYSSANGALTHAPHIVFHASTGTPTYAGTAKAGGPSYGCVSEGNSGDSGKLLTTYSLQKESLGATVIPSLAAL